MFTIYMRKPASYQFTVWAHVTEKPPHSVTVSHFLDCAVPEISIPTLREVNGKPKGEEGFKIQSS